VIGNPLPEGFATERETTIRERLARELQAVAGASDSVKNMGNQRRCIASSSTPDWLASCLRQLELTDYFGSNVFSATKHVERGKPHPDLFLYAAKQMNVEPSHAVVIEDSPTGIEAGVAAGMTVIGLLAGRHIRNDHGARLANAGAHHLARSYDDVSAILCSIALG
jgi:HAD superfamily hydrolase (TIGR01509 family)